MQNLPIDIINKIYVYLAQLNNNVWITQYTTNNLPYHRVNPHSNKLNYINKSIQYKLIYHPIPHYFNTMYSNNNMNYHHINNWFKNRFHLLSNKDL